MNVPELRFPEFEGAWEKKKLGEVCDLITKGTTPSKFVNEGIRFIKIECFDGDKINSEKCLFIDERTHNKELKRSILQENDLLFAIAGATIGKVNFVTKEILPANTNQALAIVRLKKEENRNYIYQILKSNRMLKYITDSISVGAQPNLNLEQMNNFSFYYPTLPEQTKIATFFTAVDEKIQALKKKHRLLEQYKKGVMQQLFSQELRFKDENGEEFGEWEVKKFSEYIKLYRGSSPRPINLFITKNENGVNWIKIGDTKNSKNYSIANVDEKITIEGAKKSREVFKGELILANSMSFGKTYVLNIGGCIYDGWFVLREFEKNFEKEFLHQLLNSEYLQKQYKTLSTGGVVQNISSEIVYDTFLLKPSLKEQTHIATFLSALDEKISQTAAAIEKAEVWKKGLLQKMFV